MGSKTVTNILKPAVTSIIIVLDRLVPRTAGSFRLTTQLNSTDYGGIQAREAIYSLTLHCTTI